MSIWVKICGNTSLADAQLSVEAGADAVGFVFAPSPRQVTAEQAGAIVRNLQGTMEKIGVFVKADLDEITTTVETAGLTGVQLHMDAAPSLSTGLRARFGEGLRILRVVHFDETAQDRFAVAALDPNLDGVLIDSRTVDAVGGTGKTFDWQAARETIFTGKSRVKLIAAGGLSPANVGLAISKLRPWGVDVVSGVECSPGVKDPKKVREFVETARAQSDTLS